MPTSEERKIARDEYEDSLVANVKRRRVEVLEELSTANERHKQEIAGLLREGRGLGLSMTQMTKAAGWKSRTSAYEALGIREEDL
jgi:hypothetical protein